MSKKWTREMVEEIRRKEEERQGQLPFLYLPAKGKKAKVEIIDDTFTKVFKGEKGLDERVVDWDQTQIMVIDNADNRKKAFKPTNTLATLMWLRCEEAGKDPLDMEGLVFDVERIDTFSHTASLIEAARIRDGDRLKENTIATEEQVREIAKKLIADNDDMSIKELILWSKEYLKEEGLTADKALISKLIAEEKE